MGRVSPVEKKDICSGFVRNVGTSSRVFATTEGTGEESWGLAEFGESLAVTSKSVSHEGWGRKTPGNYRAR